MSELPDLSSAALRLLSDTGALGEEAMDVLRQELSQDKSDPKVVPTPAERAKADFLDEHSSIGSDILVSHAGGTWSHETNSTMSFGSIFGSFSQDMPLSGTGFRLPLPSSPGMSPGSSLTAPSPAPGVHLGQVIPQSDQPPGAETAVHLALQPTLAADPMDDSPTKKKKEERKKKRAGLVRVPKDVIPWELLTPLLRYGARKRELGGYKFLFEDEQTKNQYEPFIDYVHRLGVFFQHEADRIQTVLDDLRLPVVSYMVFLAWSRYTDIGLLNSEPTTNANNWMDAIRSQRTIAHSWVIPQGQFDIIDSQKAGHDAGMMKDHLTYIYDILGTIAAAAGTPNFQMVINAITEGKSRGIKRYKSLAEGVDPDLRDIYNAPKSDNVFYPTNVNHPLRNAILHMDYQLRRCLLWIEYAVFSVKRRIYVEFPAVQTFLDNHRKTPYCNVGDGHCGLLTPEEEVEFVRQQRGRHAQEPKRSAEDKAATDLLRLSRQSRASPSSKKQKTDVDKQPPGITPATPPASPPPSPILPSSVKTPFTTSVPQPPPLDPWQYPDNLPRLLSLRRLVDLFNNDPAVGTNTPSTADRYRVWLERFYHGNVNEAFADFADRPSVREQIFAAAYMIHLYEPIRRLFGKGKVPNLRLLPTTRSFPTWQEQYMHYARRHLSTVYVSSFGNDLECRDVSSYVSTSVPVPWVLTMATRLPDGRKPTKLSPVAIRCPSSSYDVLFREQLLLVKVIPPHGLSPYEQEPDSFLLYEMVVGKNLAYRIGRSVDIKTPLENRLCLHVQFLDQTQVKFHLSGSGTLWARIDGLVVLRLVTPAPDDPSARVPTTTPTIAPIRTMPIVMTRYASLQSIIAADPTMTMPASDPLSGAATVTVLDPNLEASREIVLNEDRGLARVSIPFLFPPIIDENSDVLRTSCDLSGTIVIEWDDSEPKDRPVLYVPQVLYIPPRLRAFLNASKPIASVAVNDVDVTKLVAEVSPPKPEFLHVAGNNVLVHIILAHYNEAQTQRRRPLSSFIRFYQASVTPGQQPTMLSAVPPAFATFLQSIVIVSMIEQAGNRSYRRVLGEMRVFQFKPPTDALFGTSSVLTLIPRDDLTTPARFLRDFVLVDYASISIEQAEGPIKEQEPMQTKARLISNSISSTIHTCLVCGSKKLDLAYIASARGVQVCSDKCKTQYLIS